MTNENKQLLNEQGKKRKIWDMIRLFLFRLRTETQHICGDPQTTPTVNDLELSVITSCKELPLKTFIDISIDGNLSLLGKGNEMQLQSAWSKILSEYYSLIEDSQASRYVELIAGMEAIRFRAAYFDFLINALLECYHEDIADVMKELHPRFKFTPESYLKDIEYVQTIEKRHKLTFDMLKEEFDKLQQPTAKKQTDKYKNFITIMYDINKNEGFNCVTLDSSTYDYAIGLLRLNKHYEQLKQSNGRTD